MSYVFRQVESAPRSDMSSGMRVHRRNHMTLHQGPTPLRVGLTERSSIGFVHQYIEGWTDVSDSDRGGALKSPALRS